MDSRSSSKFRKLRIAWSVVWGVTAVLLIALWVRSYWWEDIWTLPGDSSQRIGSVMGWATIRWREVRPFPRQPTNGQLISISSEDREKGFARSEASARTRGGKYIRPTYRFRFIDSGTIQFHYWLPVLGLVIVAAVPWMPRTQRFSLRTLLIATTLVALMLGLAAYLLRN